jgi:hypothetical protein
MGSTVMPKPVYILCCQSGSDDEKTNLASHFNVYDRLDITLGANKSGTNAPQLILTIPLRVVSVWSADDNTDYDAAYDVQVTLRVPPAGAEISIYSGSFRFERERPRQRFTFDIQGFFVQAAGEIVAESRIRKSGDPRWLKQRYSIKVTISTELEDSVTTSQAIDSETTKPRRHIIRPSQRNQ